jgi:hypothetical protein
MEIPTHMKYHHIYCFLLSSLIKVSENMLKQLCQKINEYEVLGCLLTASELKLPF